MDEIYEIAALPEARREARIQDALDKLWAAEREVAQTKTGHAVALMRELVPNAREIRFRVEDSGYGEKYAVVHRIDGRGADQVLFDLDQADNGDVDTDTLTPVEDFLAGAAEAGAKFPRGDYGGEYVLRLVP